MTYFTALDVSLRSISICIVDARSRVMPLAPYNLHYGALTPSHSQFN